MSFSDGIALLSLAVAAFAVIYTCLSNTKKYELTEQYRNDLLKWYDNVNHILIKLIYYTENDILSDELKNELLCSLSSQIELGRFYFPNIDKMDGFGKRKPAAYRGYRNIVLEFLVFSFNLFRRNDAKGHLAHAKELQRQFTSHIFEIINPSKHNHHIHKYTNITFNHNYSLEDFLNNEPHDFLI